jgi:hypothetical protein
MNENYIKLLQEKIDNATSPEERRKYEDELRQAKNESNKNAPKPPSTEAGIIAKIVAASTRQEYAPREQLSLEDAMATYRTERAKEDTSPIMALLKTVGQIAENSLESYYKEQSFLLKAINEDLGLTGELSEDFREQISEAQPALLKLGISFDELTDSAKKLVDTTGRFALVGSDMLVRAGEIAQAYGMDMSEVVGSYAEFEKVGIGASQAQEAIADAGKRSLEVGLQSKTTIKGITENIDKLNAYGFQNGVEGLEKMVRRATEVRMSLNSVFSVADKVFDPEGALELSANLQVLGGAFGEFNDPLRLMYMATNEVEGLQGAIEGVAQNLATYNVETGGFEVTGANLRQARELAKQMGIDLKELTNAAVASQERMAAATAMEGLGLSEKQEEFLTNIARMKDGKMSIELMTPELQEKFGGATAIALENIDSATAETLLKYQDDFKEMSESDLVRKQVTLTENIQRDLQYLVTLARLEAGKATDAAVQAAIGEDSKSIGQSLSKSADEMTEKVAAYAKDMGSQVREQIKTLTDANKKNDNTSNTQTTNQNVSGNVNVNLTANSSVLGAVEKAMMKSPETWSEGLNLGKRDLLNTSFTL